MRSWDWEESRSHTQPGLEKVRGGQRPGRRPRRCSGSKPTWRGGRSGILSPSPDVDTVPLPVTQRSCWPIQKRVRGPEIFLGKKVTCSQWRLPAPKGPIPLQGWGGVWMGSLPSTHWQPQLPPQLLGGGGDWGSQQEHKRVLWTPTGSALPCSKALSYLFFLAPWLRETH